MKDKSFYDAIKHLIKQGVKNGIKALEILKKYQDDIQMSIPDFIDLDKAIEELETLNNRSCSNCKHFNKDGAFYGICKKDVNTTKNQDEFLSNVEFYCNRWEQK